MVKENKTKFCVNSGYKNLLSINEIDNGILDFNVDDGTNYAPLVITNASGTVLTYEELQSIDAGLFDDGIYNIFIEENNDPYAYKNKIFTKKIPFRVFFILP